MRQFPSCRLAAVWLMAAGAAGCFYSACYPDFGEATLAASSSHAASSHASSSSGHGAGGQGGRASASGGGGAGPCTAMTLGQKGICGQGNKCTFDMAAKMVACGLAGPTQAWGLCIRDDDCADGLWCDLQLKVCKPLCQDSSTCVVTVDGNDVQGGCVPALDSDGNPLDAALMHCTADCDPKSAAPCLKPDTTCILRQNGFNDCAKSAHRQIAQSCQAPADCEAGTVCLDGMYQPIYDTGTGKCYSWCTADAECNNFQLCFKFMPSIKYDGKEYGSCG